MERNLTKGNILKTLVAFALPFILSYFLQTLYGMADLFIIGQFCSVESTTAVSIGSQVMHMITVMMVGLAMGATVMLGRAVGGEKSDDISKTVGNTITLFLIIAVVLTGIVLLLRDAVITVMQTPEEAVAGIQQYLTVCFLGIPFIVAYNVIASVFRGMGDSKSPMYFIALACGVNILLDYLFIGFFRLGPMGAALGTTLSQTFSVVISLMMIRRKRLICLSKGDLMPSASLIRGLLSVGLPVAIQDGFIQISFLAITVFANSRGLTDAAAVGVVEKVIGILFLVPSSMLSAVSALCAQNIGAGEHERAKKTLFYAIAIATGIGLISAITMLFFAETMVGLFVNRDETAVILAGGQYLRTYVWDCVLAGIHFCFSGYFCAYGRSGISFLHNAISILTARIPLAYFASKLFLDTLMPMGLAPSIGSGISVVICLIAYQYLKKNDRLLKKI